MDSCASNGTTGIDFQAKNMKDAIQKASLHFVNNFQNKINPKEKPYCNTSVCAGGAFGCQYYLNDRRPRGYKCGMED